MIKILPIAAYDDNYIWLIRNQHYAAVVDPGDAEPVLDYLNSEGLKLSAILITHHHADHTGGNAELLAQFNVPVYGPAHESIRMMTHPLNEGDEVSLPLIDNLTFKVLDIPGHTSGHIGYYGANSLFCGDTLFGCGCGRLFEGTAAQMHDSLQKLAALPDDTRVYCAHEYTLSNIRFARELDPDNPDLLKREENDTLARKNNRPTIPSTIGIEKRTNPFLRCNEPAIIHSATKHSSQKPSAASEVFSIIREWKNRYH